MTPAVNALKKAQVDFVLHRYVLHEEPNHYGQAVADTLGVEHKRLFKTLLVAQEGDQKRLAVCIVPVSHELNLKSAAKALSVKSVTMANPKAAQLATGYVIGGISPFGQKRRLPTIVDSSAYNHDTIFASAGKRGLQIEFKAHALNDLLKAQIAPLIG